MGNCHYEFGKALLMNDFLCKGTYIYRENICVYFNRKSVQKKGSFRKIKNI